MAAAGRITVVEVEEIVAPGELLLPSATPGIYVDRLIVGQFENVLNSARCALEGTEYVNSANKWRCASPRNCATAIMSISVSAFPRWSLTIFCH